MSDEPDPEVVDDLQLRDRSAADRARTRGDGVYDWRQPKIVGKWHCFAPHCQSLVDVTEETMDRWATFNSHLASRGEPPLDHGRILRCDSCRAAFAAVRSSKLRERVDQMADLIRQLKAAQDPRREREIIAQLEKWHHPDVQGLLSALEAKQTRGSRRTEL